MIYYLFGVNTKRLMAIPIVGFETFSSKGLMNEDGDLKMMTNIKGLMRPLPVNEHFIN